MGAAPEEARARMAASAAASRAGVEIGPLDDPSDPAAIDRMIDAVWGDQRIPSELLRAFQHSGASLVGARSEGALAGFALAFPGIRDGLHLHSHMLAVHPDLRSRGIGVALKLAQRAQALHDGFREIRWTFDPLLARNAWLNLGRLGAVAVAFHPRFYGEMRDQLNRGDRSDRLEVRWLLAAPRTTAVIEGSAETVPPGPVLLGRHEAGGSLMPRMTGRGPRRGARIEIPPDYPSLKASDPSAAKLWRDAVGAAMSHAVDEGLVARWFTRAGEYVLDDVEPEVADERHRA